MKGMKAADPLDPDGANRLSKAIACLVQTQAEMDAEPSSMSQDQALAKVTPFVMPLLQFLVTNQNVNSNLTVSSNLLKACAWTYSSQGYGDKEWPPKSFPRDLKLDDDSAIKKGLDCLIAQVKNNQNQVSYELALFTNVCANLSALENAEKALGDDATTCTLDANHISAWRTAADALTASLKEARRSKVVGMPADSPLQTAVGTINNHASSDAFNDILRAADAGIANKKNQPFFADITNKCKESAEGIKNTVGSTLDHYPPPIRSNWDSNFLANRAGLPDPYYQRRDELYTKAFFLRNPTTTIPVGTLQSNLTKWNGEGESISEEINKYDGPLRDKLMEICNCAIKELKSKGLNGLLDNYCSNANDIVIGYYIEPNVTIDKLTEADAFFKQLDNDLACPAVRRLSAPQQARFDELRGTSTNVDFTKRGLIGNYTKWVKKQWPASPEAASPDDPLQPYRSFSERWDVFSKQLAGNVVQDFPSEPVSGPVDQLRQWAAKEKANRLETYAALCNAQFRRDAGFPVISASAKQLSPQDVVKLKGELNTRSNEFNKVLEKGSDQPPAFRKLIENVLAMSQVVSVLDGKAKLAVHVAADGAQNQCPYAHLTIAGHYVGRLNLSKPGGGFDLPSLSASLEIEVTDMVDPQANGAKNFYTTNWASWGALHLLTLPGVQFDAADGKWIVPLPVHRDGDGSKPPDGRINFKLELLPSLDVEKWKSLALPP
jgi:hypothetical protein